MNAKTLLIAFLCATSFAGTGLMAMQAGRMAALRQELPNARPMTAPSCDPTNTAAVFLISDTAVKRYYFDHIFEFAPLPQSPIQRAKAWAQMETVIRQKLAQVGQQM
jgi:hypothetical protein